VTGSYVPPSLADSKLARMGPGVRRSLLIAVAALVAMGIALAVITQADQFPDVELRFSPGWAALAVIGLLASEFFHATLWRMVLHRLGGDIAPLAGLRTWCVSSLGRYLPPGVLMPALRVAGATASGVAARITLASMAYEAAFSVLGAMIIATLLFTEASSTAPILAGVAAAIVIVVALHPKVFARLCNAALRRLGRDDLPTVLDTRTIFPFTVAYAGSFALVGLSVYAATEALHPVGASVLPVAVASFSVGFLVSLAAFFVPGGLGVREAGLAAALALEIPFEVALAVSVAVRVVQIVLELLLAGVTTLLDRRSGPPATSDA
jgi:glycosyltransferase 2 family protein